MTNNEKLAVIKDLETIRLFLSKDKEKLKAYAVDYIGYDGGLINREYHTFLPSLHAFQYSFFRFYLPDFQYFSSIKTPFFACFSTIFRFSLGTKLRE